MLWTVQVSVMDVVECLRRIVQLHEDSAAKGSTSVVVKGGGAGGGSGGIR